MEIIDLRKPFKVFYVEAASFPEGIREAHDRVGDLVPFDANRSLYGISHPVEDGSVRYMAAATEYVEGEGKNLNCQTFIINEGKFLCITLKNWKDDLPEIGRIFDKLTADPRVLKNGYCLEEYAGENMLRCMVPLQAEFTEAKNEKSLLIEDISVTFERLRNALSAFGENTINQIPFEGSWTAGQTAEHIIICGNGIPDNTTTSAGRFPDEKVAPIKELFLNFGIKFKTDPTIAPGPPPHDKQSLLKNIKQIKEVLISAAGTGNLEELCLDMELPTFGNLTRYEWLQFVLFHTQRHTQQILDIYKHVNIQGTGNSA